jgi:hypothetical protein
MNWINLLKRDESLDEWKKRQMRAGKTLNRRTEEWKRMQRENEAVENEEENPQLPHIFTGRRRDVGDEKGEGYRDVAAGRSKGARKGQRARLQTKVQGGGERQTPEKELATDRHLDEKGLKQEKYEEKVVNEAKEKMSKIVSDTQQNLFELENMIDEAADFDASLARQFRTLESEFDKLLNEIQNSGQFTELLDTREHWK